MKYLIALCFFAWSQVWFSQNKNEIYVIGNIHQNVPNYNPAILFGILDQIKPDIILHEVDSKGMNEYEAMAETDLKENEITASTQYLKKYPKTIRAPFDFEGRNQYRKDKGMVPTDNLAVQLIDSLYKAKSLDATDSKIYERFLSTTEELKKVAELAPKNFNNAENDQLCEKRQNEQYHELTKITDKRPEFAKRFVVKPNGEKISYRDGFKLMSGFWDLRNQTMASNIYKAAAQHPGKKIVVLTGFLHRYYIIKQLTKLNDLKYVIKEFYDL
ncbi:TraB/GumN family protein [Chryseobacterium paridis]|uniref:TraB/GumN family protein n=1 Tax=Chryseobacterium paridis TaxID=2800328 RepID=A0ABS1FRT7_9FLAO|nr:hypothetical protein [Chryseobacterium paridis]MBK1895135.1 hypothetical protein [Chryseobacterium paridis]